MRASVGGDGKGLHLDTADTFTIDDGELDEASITPGGVPGVLDEPVVLAGGGIVSPSHSEDGVVKAGSALRGVKDTGSVGLEDSLIGLNGDGQRLGGKGGLHLVDAVLGDESVVADIDRGGRPRVVKAGGTGTITRGVGVGGLELGVVLLVVLESLVLPATTATVVSGGAGDELLLREAEEFTSGEEVGTLNCTGGGESPA